MAIEIDQTSLVECGTMDEQITTLQDLADETRILLRRTSEDIVQIGKNLLEAKTRLPHGQFIPWVRSEIGISQKTAWRFMQIAQGKSVTMTDLPVIAPVKRDNGNERVGNSPSLEDRRETVKAFFSEFPHLQALSDREIARRCGVDHKTVAAVRKELFPDPQPEPVKKREPAQPSLPKTEPSEETQVQREVKRQAILDRNEQLKEKGVELPINTYACLVVDPPWPMTKIEREVRPNQMEFDYPTMRVR